MQQHALITQQGTQLRNYWRARIKQDSLPR